MLTSQQAAEYLGISPRELYILLKAGRIPAFKVGASIGPPARGGLRALNVAQGRGLRPTLGGREAHPVRDIGDGIAVRVNLELVQRLGL
jgi:excisionase family DNA binding protein